MPIVAATCAPSAFAVGGWPCRGTGRPWPPPSVRSGAEHGPGRSCPWPPRTARAARAAGDRGGARSPPDARRDARRRQQRPRDLRLPARRPRVADPTLLILGLGLGAIAMALWAARRRAAVGAALALLPAVIGAGAAAVVVKRTSGRITGDEARAAARDTTKSALRARLGAPAGHGEATLREGTADCLVYVGDSPNRWGGPAVRVLLPRRARRCKGDVVSDPSRVRPALRRRTEQRLLAGVAGGWPTG